MIRRGRAQTLPALSLALLLSCVAGAATMPVTAAAATAPAGAKARAAAGARSRAHPPAAAGAWPARAAAMHQIAIAEDERRWSDGELARLLRHPDATVRARAALAVGRLQDSTSVEALAPLLRDASAAVREEAAFALGQIGRRAARPALEALLPRATPALRGLAVEALGKLADPAATPAVVRALADPAPAVRGAAAVALWRLADSTALGPLLARVQDPDPGVRWRVIYALEKIVAPMRVVPALAPRLADPEWLTRAYAARTLGRQKSPLATPHLLPMLADAEPAVVVNAIRALQLAADSTCGECLAHLIQALGHADPYVRVTAATALADRFAWVAADTVTRTVAIDTLAARLTDPDAATRGATARALAARAGADAVSALTPLLDDPSVYTRTATLQALATLPPDRVEALIVEHARPGRALFERMTALEALGSLKTPASVPLLRAALADSAVLVAASAAGALGDAGDTASVPALVAAFTTRTAAADADARQSIRDALRQLAGRAFADSLERAHPAPAPRIAYAADFEAPSPWRGAVLHTAKGDIEWAFYRTEAVQTVKNFARLAERGYFDGLAIHRVVPNFVIQDGDPTGTGSGGPGWTIRCEYNRLHYEPGMVGMALSGKDTGGSQWFITHSPQPHLDGRYTIFAHVTRGMDVVQRIVQGDRVLGVKLLR